MTSLVHGEDEEHGVAELELLVVVPVEELEEVVRLSPLLHILLANAFVNYYLMSKCQEFVEFSQYFLTQELIKSLFPKLAVMHVRILRPYLPTHVYYLKFLAQNILTLLGDSEKV